MSSSWFVGRCWANGFWKLGGFRELSCKTDKSLRTLKICLTVKIRKLEIWKSLNVPLLLSACWRDRLSVSYLSWLRLKLEIYQTSRRVCSRAAHDGCGRTQFALNLYLIQTRSVKCEVTNSAVLINYASRLWYCVASFSPQILPGKMFQCTFAVTWECLTWPPCCKKTSSTRHMMRHQQQVEVSVVVSASPAMNTKQSTCCFTLKSQHCSVLSACAAEEEVRWRLRDNKEPGQPGSQLEGPTRTYWTADTSSGVNTRKLGVCLPGIEGNFGLFHSSKRSKLTCRSVIMTVNLLAAGCLQQLLGFSPLLLSLKQLIDSSLIQSGNMKHEIHEYEKATEWYLLCLIFQI